MEPGKVWIIGPESNGVVLVELFAEQIEAVSMLECGQGIPACAFSLAPITSF